MANQPISATYQPGDMIGDYEVHHVLGSGGFGIVYCVLDHRAKNVYALKTFKDEFLTNIEIWDLFEKESQILVELGHHPNLVQSYFVQRILGRPFIALEYIDPNEQGINTLEGYLRIYQPSIIQTLRWAIQICYGMEHAYSKGIRTHRDIKPGNIMIDKDGIAKVSDFGLAGIVDSFFVHSIDLGSEDKFAKTQIGVGFGTTVYMPPEQFVDVASCDERSDIYAVGVVLFEMIGGNLPFLAEPPRDDSQEERMRFSLAMQNLHSRAPVPVLISPLFPVIKRCLEKDTKNRYQNFKQLRLDLESELKKQNGETLPPPQLKIPDDTELYNKGFSLLNLGQYNDAILFFDQALNLSPQEIEISIGAWIGKGRAFDRLGRYEDAIRCYDQSLKIAPDHINAFTYKSFSLICLNQYEKAIHCCDRALKYDPENADALANKALCLKDYLHQYEESISYCDKAIKINPRHVNALTCKGNCLYTLKYYEESISCYTKALEIFPYHTPALFGKVESLGSLGRYEECVEYLLYAFQKDPNNIKVLYDLSILFKKLGYYDEVVLWCDKVLEIAPHVEGAWYNKGYSLDNLGRYEEAIRCHDKMLEINPQNEGAWYNKGNSLAHLDRYEEAIRCYDRALKIDPRHVMSWLNKGSSLYQLGRYAESEQIYKQFIFLAPAEYGEKIKFARQRIKEIENANRREVKKQPFVANVQANISLQRNRNQVKKVPKRVPTIQPRKNLNVTPSKKNTRQMVIFGLLFLLFCICCVYALLGFVWLWNNGDAIFHSLGI